MSKVFLVGAGPGDPQLLTVKAYRLLERADVVLHDDLVSSEILELVCPEAVVMNVGKRCGKRLVTQKLIHALLIWFAASAETVVRLKGGDPLLFGRAAEEMEALAGAGVDYEVVPGVTAAVAAAAAAGISLTDRRSCSHVVFTTAQHAASRGGTGKEEPEWLGARDRRGMERDWQGLARGDTTMAVYMPGKDYATLARDLTSAGFSGEIPCMLISRIGGKDQHVHRSSLNRLADCPPLAPPTLLLVGKTLGQKAMAASIWSPPPIEESIADLGGFGQTALYIVSGQD